LLSPPPTSFSEYLHEKADESRHNEIVGYLTVIIGSIFFVSGLLETVVTVESPEWFLILPYHLTPSPYSLLGLALTAVGITLLGLGIVMGIHYARERSWYMKKLRSAYAMEELKLRMEKENEARNASAVHTPNAPRKNRMPRKDGKITFQTET